MQAYMRSLCTEEDGQMKLHFFSCVSALLDATNKHGRLLIKGWGRGCRKKFPQPPLTVGNWGKF